MEEDVSPFIIAVSARSSVVVAVVTWILFAGISTSYWYVSVCDDSDVVLWIHDIQDGYSLMVGVVDLVSERTLDIQPLNISS